MAYMVIDDLLNKAIGIRLLEPAVQFSTVPKAKLKIFNPHNVNSHYSADNHMKPIEKKITEKPPKLEPEDLKKRRVLNIENKPIPNITLKKEVAKFPYVERARANEVAEVFEEMLQAVSEGKTSLPRREGGGIINKAVEERRKQQEEDDLKKKLKDQKLERRYKELKEKHGNLIDFRKQQREDRLKKIKEEEEKEKLRRLNPQREKTRKAHAEDIKKQAKDYKEEKKKKEEDKKKEEEEKQKQLEQKKKQEFEEFNKKKIEKIETRFKNKKEKEQKEKEEEERKEKERQELKKKERLKAQEVLKKDKEGTEHDKKFFTEFSEAIHNKEHSFRKLFDQNEVGLQLLFNYYYNSVHHPIDRPFPKDELVFEAFTNFMSDFIIYPSIIDRNDSIEIFNGLTSHKKLIELQPASIDYFEFLEVLGRVAYKGHSKFEKLFERKSRVERIEKSQKGDNEDDNKPDEVADDKKDDAVEEAKDNGEQEEESKKAAADLQKSPKKNKVETAPPEPIEFAEIDSVSTNTLEGLLYYLSVPNDKVKFKQRIEELKNEKLNWREKKNYWKKDLAVDNIQNVIMGKFGAFEASADLDAGDGGDEQKE